MKIDVPHELATLNGAYTRRGLRHRSLRDFDVGASSMLGVALLERSTSPDHWEVHDGGDELLFVVGGRIGVEICRADGPSDWQTISSGQCLVIPRGVAHAVIVLEEAAVVFVTPREGSRSWQAADVTQSPQPLEASPS